MAWFKKQKGSEQEAPKRSKVAEGMWLKCNHCREIVYRKEVERNSKVCPKCDYHFPISVIERITLLVDFGTFKEWDAELGPLDPWNHDTKSYKDRVKAQQEKTGKKDAIMIGEGQMNGRRVALCLFDFGFMGGSMGSVVGEKICRAIDRAIQARLPVVLVTASGGARMQEGILSLMQMAKTSAAVAKLGEAKLPDLSPGGSNVRRGDGECRHAWRRHHCRTEGSDRVCRASGDRTDHQAATAGPISASRVSVGTRDDRHDCRAQATQGDVEHSRRPFLAEC